MTEEVAGVPLLGDLNGKPEAEEKEPRWTVRYVREHLKVEDVHEVVLGFMIEWTGRRMADLHRDQKLGVLRRNATREELFELILKTFRAGFVCHYCGRPLVFRDPSKMQSPSLDHIRAKSVHIGTRFDIICHPCNCIKGTMEPEEYESFLGYLPTPERVRILTRLYIANAYAYNNKWRPGDFLRQFGATLPDPARRALVKWAADAHAPQGVPEPPVVGGRQGILEV